MAEKYRRTKADIQLIRNLWTEHISKTVVLKQLYKILNDLLDSGLTSDYLVFVMTYVIEKRLNLRYPAGLKYYVDKQEILDAYTRKQLSQQRYDKNSFVISERSDDAPKFSVTTKTRGFQSILDENK